MAAERSLYYALVPIVSMFALIAPFTSLHAQGDGYGGPPSATASAYGYVPSPPLAPGDAIALRFWQEPQLSGQFPIDENGLVILPLLGVRQVTLWPADQVKLQIIHEYARQLRDQPAHVTMLRRVRVLGSVRNPGLYHADATMTLGDVLALAGGADSDAKQGQIRLYRNGRLLYARVDGSAMIPDLRSGDQIVVPQTSWIERNFAVIAGGALTALAILARR